jgi:hypothetical protein
LIPVCFQSAAGDLLKASGTAMKTSFTLWLKKGSKPRHYHGMLFEIMQSEVALTKNSTALQWLRGTGFSKVFHGSGRQSLGMYNTNISRKNMGLALILIPL